MKRRLGFIAGLVTVAAFLYVAYAAYSLDQIVQAIMRADSVALAGHIDFPAVRESLKKQLKDALDSESSRPSGDAARPQGDLARALRSEVSGAMIDVLATPAGLAALIAKRRAEGRIVQHPTFSPAALWENLSIRGPTRLLLNQGDDNEIAIGFKDWRWQIVDIKTSPEKLRLLEVDPGNR